MLSVAKINSLNQNIGRNLTQITANGALYIWKIEDCGYFKIVNSSASVYTGSPNSWGGEYQVSTNFSLPYVIFTGSGSSSQPRAGATVGVNGIANQTGGFSGQGGFGFEGKLPQSDYFAVTANTDADGLAFVNMNISKGGRFRVFWKINTTTNVGEVDTADFSTASDIDVKSFRTWGQPSFNIPLGKVTLYYQDNNEYAWGAFQLANGAPLSYGTNYFYNGTVNESQLFGKNGFVRDTINSTWYIVYNPNATSTGSGNVSTASGYWWGALKIDDDANFSDDEDSGSATNYSVNQLGTKYLNDTFNIPVTFGASSGQRIGISAYNIVNQSSAGAANNITLVFYQRDPSNTQNGFMMNVNSGTENVTVSVCAETYDRPNSRPLAGATVTELYVRDWMAMGAKKSLQIYDLINDSAVSSVQIGPNGCIAVKVGPKASGLTEWTRGQTVWIEGTAVNNTNTESFNAGGVWRSWM